MHTQPPRRRSKTWVKTPFSSTWADSALAVERIGSVGDGDVANHAHGDHALIEVLGLIFAGNHQGQLLIAGGDVAVAGYVHKQRGKNQFQAILVVPIDGIRPGIFDFLELADLRGFQRR